MVEKDALNTPAIAVIGVVGTVVTLVSVLCVQVLFHQTEGAQSAQRNAAAGTPEMRVMLAEQRASLEGYAWIDEAAGRVTIPVDQAMQLVARDIAANSPSASF